MIQIATPFAPAREHVHSTRATAQLRAALIWRSAQIAALLNLAYTRALTADEHARLAAWRADSDQLLSALRDAATP